MNISPQLKTEILHQAAELEKYGYSSDGTFSGFVALLQHHTGIAYDAIYQVLINR